MTVAQAKQIFATHMQAARKRKLAPYELKQLATARQTLRQAAKPIMNKSTNKPVARKRTAAMRTNPQEAVLIYGNVQRIEAVKTQSHLCDDECKAVGHRYFHEFTTKPKMYGLPDGSLLIKV